RQVDRREPSVPRLHTLAAAATGAALAASVLKEPTHPAVSPLPDDFRWGVALAGFQSEGHSPDSNWRRYSEQHAPTVTDEIGDAADWFSHVTDDVARA